jgi:hypothetical protein
MRKILFAFLLATSCVMIFATCNKSQVAASDINSATLHNCTGNLAEPYICFDSLLTDSRCPTGAVCIWQGTALIKISFHEKGNVHSFIMSLKGFPSMGYTSDTILNGYHVVFSSLEPYPDLDKPAPKNTDLRASFSITP